MKIKWRKTKPPENEKLLMITRGGYLGVGWYDRYGDVPCRVIEFWLVENYNAPGETVMWTKLPTNREIEALLKGG